MEGALASARMRRLRNLARRVYWYIPTRKARLAGFLVREMTSGQTPSFAVRLLYAVCFQIYFIKRILQDIRWGNIPVSRLSIAERRRDLEANFLIRLVVFRDWPIHGPPNLYPVHVANNRLTSLEAEKMREESALFTDRPLISVVVPVYNARPEWIERLVDSLIAQTYDRWELVLVDDCSPDVLTWDTLERANDRDERITIHRLESNQGVVVATNHATTLANGDWIAFADHDDELMADALWWIASTLQGSPEADVIYTDEEIFDDGSGFCYPHIKPAFSPQLLTSYNYICHFLAVRRDLFESVGRLREGFEGAQDYDLILRLIEVTDRVVHIPRLLYRWHIVPRSMSRFVDPKTNKLCPVESIDAKTARVVQEHLDRLSIPAQADVVKNWAKPVYLPADHGKVTIIICSKDQPKRLRRCIESIEKHTLYPNYEIMVVDNGSVTAASLKYLNSIKSKHRIERIESGSEGFNFSKLNNEAARRADGDYLLFLNDDTYVLSTGWLSALIGNLQFPKMGAVGARLLYPNRLNQHAGLIVGTLNWGPWHALIGVPADNQHYGGYFTYPHNCIAVTGACLATRRETFLHVGGFNETEFAVSFNDVDYCLRLGREGLRVSYAPQAELIHEEGASRGRFSTPGESLSLKSRWYGFNDPYWNINYSRQTPHFSLSPRRQPRGLDLVTTPRVFFVRADDDPLEIPSFTEQVLDRLDAEGSIELVPLAAESELPWADDIDVLIVEGVAGREIIREAATRRIQMLWSLPGRLVLPESADWQDRGEILDTIQALSLPYQVVFSDAYSMGWAAAGLPRANLFLVTRAFSDPMSGLGDQGWAWTWRGPDRTNGRLSFISPPLHHETQNASPHWPREEARQEIRSYWRLNEEDTLLLAVIPPGETRSLEFLLTMYRGLSRKERERLFLLVAVEDELSETTLSRVRKQVSALGDRVAVLAARDSYYAAADLVLAHLTIDPRPAGIIKALEAGLPVLGTRLVEYSDLMHQPATGLSARPFHAREWRRRLRKLLKERGLFPAMGAQGSHWLHSRETFVDSMRHWRELITEAAELGIESRQTRPVPASSRNVEVAVNRGL